MVFAHGHAQIPSVAWLFHLFNIMYVMAYINGAAQACPIYISHNGIMLNRSLGFLSVGLSLKRTAATPRGPPGRRRRCGGFRRYRSLLPARPRPPYPCLPVRRLVSGFVRSSAAAVPHPYSCFRSVSVAPGRGCRRYRLFLPARPRPPYQCLGVPSVSAVSFGFSVRRAPPFFVLSFGVCRRVCRPRGAFGGPFVLARPSPPSPGVVSACLVSWRYRCSSPIRARPPYSCFRSVGFRRPLAVEDSDRRSKQVRATLGIVIRGYRRASCLGGTVDR